MPLNNSNRDGLAIQLAPYLMKKLRHRQISKQINHQVYNELLHCEHNPYDHDANQQSLLNCYANAYHQYVIAVPKAVLPAYTQECQKAQTLIINEVNNLFDTDGYDKQASRLMIHTRVKRLAHDWTTEYDNTEVNRMSRMKETIWAWESTLYEILRQWMVTQDA